jgi:hypothetical protein
VYPLNRLGGNQAAKEGALSANPSRARWITIHPPALPLDNHLEITPPDFYASLETEHEQLSCTI